MLIARMALKILLEGKGEKKTIIVMKKSRGMLRTVST